MQAGVQGDGKNLCLNHGFEKRIAEPSAKAANQAFVGISRYLEPWMTQI